MSDFREMSAEFAMRDVLKRIRTSPPTDALAADTVYALEEGIKEIERLEELRAGAEEDLRGYSN